MAEQSEGPTQEAAGQARTERRAVEVALWGMPIVSVQAMRRAFFDAGAQYGDVLYFSKPADWKYQVTTPNSSTYYLQFHSNSSDGPVVIDIPAEEAAGVFGSILDAWQVPLVDVGGAGEDGGRGGKYLLLPPGYGEPVPDGYIAVPTQTYNTYGLLRMIPRSTSDQDVAAALALGEKVATYSLPTGAAEPRPSRHIDIADTLFDGLVRFDASVYANLAEMLNEEPLAERDLVAAAYARSLGIAPGQPFDPDPETRAILDAAAETAHQEAMAAVSRVLPLWPTAPHWGLHRTNGPETGFTFRDADDYDIDGRALLYFLAFAVPKHLGGATFYVVASHDADGNPLRGAASYRLNVPAKVPALDYWAVTVYDLQTAALVRDAPNPGPGLLRRPRHQP